MSDFERVAAGMRGRVGAPWAGVAGPQVVWPPPAQNGMVGQPAVPTQQQGKPIYYNPPNWMFGGNSYMSLAKRTPADNTVAASDTRTFKRVPERPFQPLQFMAVSWVQDLLIVQISMNNKNFMSHDSESGMPITLLSEVSQAMGINWATINTSNGVTTQVANTDTSDHQFLAAFSGIQLDGQ